MEFANPKIRLDYWLPVRFKTATVLAVAWSSLWLSVGAEPPISIGTNVSTSDIRAGLALITLCPVLFYSFKFRVHQNMSNIETGILIYCLILFLSGLVSGLDDHFYYFPCLMISAVLTLKTALKIDEQPERVLRLYCLITFIVLFLYLVVFGWLYLAESIRVLEAHGYMVGSSLATNATFYSSQIPRPTGLGRSAVILVFLMTILIRVCELKSHWRFFFNSIFIGFVLYTQARGTLVAVGLVMVIYVFLLDRKVIFKCLPEIIYTLALALMFLGLLNLYIFGANMEWQYSLAVRDLSQVPVLGFDEPGSMDNVTKLQATLNVWSSGRIGIWSQLLLDGKNSLFFGQGVQADRALLGTSASNVFIYAYVCTGLAGLAIVVSVGVGLAKKSFKAITDYASNVDKSFIDLFLVAMLSFIGARAMFETGPGVFGVDYLSFVLAVCFLSKLRKVARV